MNKKSASFALSLVTASALAGGYFAGASAAGGAPNTTNSKPSHIPEGASAMTPPPRVFAVVNANGSVLRGKGLTSVTKLGTGIYDVRFGRSITTCSWVGTVGFGTFSGSTGPAMITITGRVGTNNGLFVTTFTGTGAAADLPFNADVICA